MAVEYLQTTCLTHIGHTEAVLDFEKPKSCVQAVLASKILKIMYQTPWNQIDVDIQPWPCTEEDRDASLRYCSSSLGYYVFFALFYF